MKKIALILIVLIICCGFINRKEVDKYLRGYWFPKECVLLDDNPNDEYNGMHTNLVVRPKNTEYFNKNGYGIVTMYGEWNGQKFINVDFKNCSRGYDPFDLHKVKVIKPKHPPEWFIKKKYHWFYEENGEKTAMWKYWESL